MTCEFCKIEFSIENRKKSRIHKFCSLECSQKYRKDKFLKPVEIECNFCKKVFNLNKSTFKKRSKYNKTISCSIGCKSILQSNKIKINCKFCKNEFFGYSQRKFCSNNCRFYFSKKSLIENKCKVCFKSFKNKRFKIICSPKCAGINNSNIFISKKENFISRRNCKSCGIIFIFKKSSANLNLYCSTICALRSPLNKKFEVKLEDRIINVRSRWEAVFVKDFLEKNNLNWNYEPKTFILEDGRKYTPDFYIKNYDQYVEIKGYNWNNSLEKVEKLKKTGINIILVDKNILENTLSLNLNKKYADSFCKRIEKIEENK